MYGLQFFYQKNQTWYGKHNYRIEFWREGFTGQSVEILKAVAEPTNKSNPATDGSNYNVFAPIWGTDFRFEFFEQSNVQLENLLANYERAVRLDYYLDGVLEFRGWVLSDECFDSANGTIQSLSISANDNLGLLKDIPLLIDDYDKAFDLSVKQDYVTQRASSSWNWNNLQTSINAKKIGTTLTILQLIKACLDKTNLEIPFEITNDLFEASLKSDVRVFEKIKADYLAFQSSSGESYSCEKVLKSILAMLGCVVMQEGGFWKVKRISYLESCNVIAERYDKDGKFLVSIKQNIQTKLFLKDLNNWKWLYDSHDRRVRQSYLYQNLIYEYDESLNLLKDSYVFRNNKPIPPSYTIGANTTVVKKFNEFYGTVSLEVKDPYRNNSIKSGLFLPPIEIPTRDTKITINLATNGREFNVLCFFDTVTAGGRGGTSTRRYYWKQDGNYWTTLFNPASAGAFIYEGKGEQEEYQGERGGVSLLSYVVGRSIDLPQFPSSGTLTVVLKGGNSTYITDRGEVGVHNVISYQDVKIDSKLTKEIHSFQQLNKVSYRPDDITVYNGDSFRDLSSRSTLVLEDEVTPTKFWADSSVQEASNLLSFTTRTIMGQFSKTKFVIEGTLKSKKLIKIGTVLTFDSYSKFRYKKLLVIPPFSHNVDEDEYKLTLFELSCGSAEGILLEYYNTSDDVPLYKFSQEFKGFVCPVSFEVDSFCINPTFEVDSFCINMIPYLSITNNDATPYINYFWAVLPNYNRLETEVTSFDLVVQGIPTTSNFGFKSPVGEVTVFRKNKIDGKVDFANWFVKDCNVSSNIAFYPTQLDPEPNFNFKLNITIAELAGNLLSAIEYGYSRNNIEVITNWQTSNVFDLVDEGSYYFDVRVIGSGVSVGKQLVELSLNANGTTITGGDETDNPLNGTSSGDEN